jgi:hypothetical protein
MSRPYFWPVDDSECGVVFMVKNRCGKRVTACLSHNEPASYRLWQG